MEPVKTQICCASIHAPDHGMKQNSVGIIYTLKKLCMRLYIDSQLYGKARACIKSRLVLIYCKRAAYLTILLL